VLGTFTRSSSQDWECSLSCFERSLLLSISRAVLPWRTSLLVQMATTRNDPLPDSRQGGVFGRDRQTSLFHPAVCRSPGASSGSLQLASRVLAAGRKKGWPRDRGADPLAKSVVPRHPQRRLVRLGRFEGLPNTVVGLTQEDQEVVVLRPED